MNCKEIAFIICVNDIQYYEECVRYIKDLDIPNGYNIDIISIQEAETIAQGYNAAMQSSDAKYKVYLHQDTFILNRNFLFSIIDIFENDETIGMIGMRGSNTIRLDEKCDLVWEIGNVKVYDGKHCRENRYQQTNGQKYTPVQIVDGFLLATQYDVCWREDLIDGWDYYEISQSIEMKRQGYKVVIPYQGESWCYHDCCVSEYKDAKVYWTKFIKEYPEVEWGEIDGNKLLKKRNILEQISTIRDALMDLLCRKEYKELCSIADDIRGSWPEDILIREIVNMIEIYSMESDSVEQIHSFWLEQRSVEDIYGYYRWVRFVILRMAVGCQDDRIFELESLVEKAAVSKDAIRKLSSIVYSKPVTIYNRLVKEEGEKPLVSVVVATYNCVDVISKTLDSILNQTYQNLEIIIVDDASTDGTRELLSSYNDSRINKIFFEKNKNFCFAGNTAFEMAQGKYICIIGHDDFWEPDKIEKQVLFMEQHPSYGVCFTWADIVDENGNSVNEKWSMLSLCFHSCNFSQKQYFRKMINGNTFCAPTACVRQEFLKKTGYYRYALVQLQDWDLWLRMLLEGPVYILEEELTHYRRFNGTGKNISEVNKKTIIRDGNEKQWIQYDILNRISDDQFIEIFAEDFIYINAKSRKEVLCEKAFLLKKLGNCFLEKEFIELFEDEECREILERKYSFSLQDFYEMNCFLNIKPVTYI